MKSLLFISIIILSCNTTKKMEKESTIGLFRKIMVGDFNNDQQIADEIANGKQIHPKAKHVNRIADEKITDLPKTKAVENFWILEESYYEYPNKPVEVKPYLFNFSQGADNTVLLTVYQLPTNIDKKEIRNDNPNLKFSFYDLKLSPSFKGATYVYDKEKKVFTTNSVNDLGNGMQFTLTETLSLDKLIVMELVQKNGQRLTLYDTPIIYDRK
jgi:hypothetical protein